jgi:hypothetical protein
MKGKLSVVQQVGGELWECVHLLGNSNMIR